MKILLARFATDESGATAIEYGLIATLVGVAIIAGASALGTPLNTLFSGLGSTMANPQPPSDGGSGGGADSGG